MNARQPASKAVQTHPIRHVPQRMCVICRKTAAKRGLIRIVRTADATLPEDSSTDDNSHLQVDPGGKRSGRGAYLCDQLACWQRAADGDMLAKALRMTFSAADRHYLRAMIPSDPGSGPAAAAESSSG